MKSLTTSNLVRASLAAGLAAAVTEMVFVLPIQARLGASPLVVFQSIAGGALGKTAFKMGLASGALGVGIHLFISVVAAAVYVVASRLWDDVLVRRPVVCGVVYGAVVYEVMTFLVVPLSAFGFHPAKSIALVSMSILVHLFAFGLPIALVSRWMLQERPR